MSEVQKSISEQVISCLSKSKEIPQTITEPRKITIFHSWWKSVLSTWSLNPVRSSASRIQASVPSHFDIRALKLGLLTTIHRRWQIAIHWIISCCTCSHIFFIKMFNRTIVAVAKFHKQFVTTNNCKNSILKLYSQWSISRCDIHESSNSDDYNERENKFNIGKLDIDISTDSLYTSHILQFQT